MMIQIEESRYQALIKAEENEKKLAVKYVELVDSLIKEKETEVIVNKISKFLKKKEFPLNYWSSMYGDCIMFWTSSLQTISVYPKHRKIKHE